MRYPSRFAVWSALLTFCVLFWVWVVGLLIDWFEVEKQPECAAIVDLVRELVVPAQGERGGE